MSLEDDNEGVVTGITIMNSSTLDDTTTSGGEPRTNVSITNVISSFDEDEEGSTATASASEHYHYGGSNSNANNMVGGLLVEHETSTPTAAGGLASSSGSSNNNNNNNNNTIPPTVGRLPVWDVVETTTTNTNTTTTPTNEGSMNNTEKAMSCSSIVVPKPSPRSSCATIDTDDMPNMMRDRLDGLVVQMDGDQVEVEDEDVKSPPSSVAAAAAAAVVAGSGVMDGVGGIGVGVVDVDDDDDEVGGGEGGVVHGSLSAAVAAVGSKSNSPSNSSLKDQHSSSSSFHQQQQQKRFQQQQQQQQQQQNKLAKGGKHQSKNATVPPTPPSTPSFPQPLTASAALGAGMVQAMPSLPDSDGPVDGVVDGDGGTCAILRSIADLKSHTNAVVREMRDSTRKDLDKILNAIHQETQKRSSLEGRFHSQLLLQSETMIAMELKLLRLEAKVEKRDAQQRHQQQQHQQQQQQRRTIQNNPTSTSGGIPSSSSGGRGGSGSISIGGGSSTQLPPIAATSPNGIEEGEEEEFGSVDIVGTGSRGGERVDRRGDRDRGGGVGGSGVGGGGLHHHSHHHSHQPSHHHHHLHSDTPGPNIAVISSGASLASAVSATTFLDGESTHVDDGGSTKESTINDEDGSTGSSDDGDVEDEGDGGVTNDGSASTPTQGSRNPIATLDSILMNPILHPPSDNTSEHGTTRAIRGDALTDGNSSLATSVTSATLTSTVITATTRGGDSLNNPGSVRVSRLGTEGESTTSVSRIVDGGGVAGGGGAGGGDTGGTDADAEELYDTFTAPERSGLVRSRSTSPVTVQSATTASVGPESVASMSVGTSVLSTAAVAPSRSFHTRRLNAAVANAAAGSNQGVVSGNIAGGSGNIRSSAIVTGGDAGRPLANRVVSFTNNQTVIASPTPPHHHPQRGGVAENQTEAISEAGDSITMPDELDNLSDVADAFASNSRLWREEYEARLDAIQKRWAMGD